MLKERDELVKMILFHYLSRDSTLHKLSPVTKLLAMIILGLTAIVLQDIYTDWLAFTFIYALIFFLYYKAKISFIHTFRDLRYFLTVIPLIIFFSAFKFQASENLFLQHFQVQGLITASTFILKLYLFSLLSILFIATTTVREINNALESLLCKIPFVNSVRIATMISLCIVQIPIIFDLYNQIRLAQKARCLDYRKNPWQRVIIILNILIQKVLQNADNIALNYESKCYNEERINQGITIPAKETLYLLTFMIYCLLVSVIF
jgi:energy-coupling factor transporter transmembrane protein EcfT